MLSTKRRVKRKPKRGLKEQSMHFYWGKSRGNRAALTGEELRGGRE